MFTDKLVHSTSKRRESMSALSSSSDFRYSQLVKSNL